MVSNVLKSSLCAVIQLIFSSLDRINKNNSETLDYIMVAKRREKARRDASHCKLEE